MYIERPTIAPDFALTLKGQFLKSLMRLHMGPNNLCYVTRHFLLPGKGGVFFPYVTMSLFGINIH